MSVATARPGVRLELPVGASGRLGTARMAGISALAFAFGVVVANVAVMGAPLAGATAAEAAAWYQANGMRMMVANAMIALTFPALLVFGAAMFEMGRERENARGWMLLGALGGVAMVGVFSILVAANISAVLLAGVGGEAFAVAWILHFAAFAINMTALGTAFLGFSLGAHATGLTPAWQRTAGVVGAMLLLATGFGNTAVAAGSTFAFVGFVGFLLWLVWIVVLGVRLTGGSAAAPS